MGFGLLFIAFTMLFVVFGYQIDPATNLGFDILPDLLAYILIYRGLKNLKPYSKGFVYARMLTIPLMGLGAVTFVSQVIAMIGAQVPSVAKYWGVLSTIVDTVDTVSIPFLFFLLVNLCMGIETLAREVELPKVVTRAKIASFLSCAYFIGKLLVGILPLPNIVQWLMGILSFVVYFVYLYLLFSCYMRIVYADEPPKQMFNPLFHLLDKSKKKDSDSK